VPCSKLTTTNMIWLITDSDFQNVFLRFINTSAIKKEERRRGFSLAESFTTDELKEFNCLQFPQIFVLLQEKLRANDSKVLRMSHKQDAIFKITKDALIGRLMVRRFTSGWKVRTQYNLHFWDEKPILNIILIPLSPFHFWSELIIDVNIPFQTWSFKQRSYETGVSWSISSIDLHLLSSPVYVFSEVVSCWLQKTQS